LLLNWNGIAFTKKAIKSLLKTQYPNFEIIVVDNGSMNNEKEKLQNEFKKYPNIRIFGNPLNLGYAAGMNAGFKHTKGELIMFLNNDMEFEKNWLNPLVKKLLSDKKIAMCQPKIKDLKAKDRFEYAAAAGGFIDIFGYPFARGRIFSKIEKDYGQYDNEKDIAWTGVFLTTKKVLKKIGLFDSIYFNYAEDVDLCFRAYANGYKIAYVPSSIVYHYGGGAMGKNLSRKMFYIHRNHLILILKNWEFKTLLIILVPRFLMDVATFFYYLVSGYSNFSLALIKAYMSLLSMSIGIYKSRNSISSRVRKNGMKKMPIYEGSIAWQYFVYRKNKFSQIIK
jgi:GT2 family glycosyltransferase